MPELYVYAILILAVLVTIGFVLVLRDDKEVKRSVDRKAPGPQPAIVPPAPVHPAPVPVATATPAPVVAATPLPSAQPLPSAEDRPAPSQRRRRVLSDADESGQQALVAHLTRETEDLRIERQALKDETRHLRDALADAALTIRALEAKLASAEAAASQGNVYSLHTKRVG